MLADQLDGLLVERGPSRGSQITSAWIKGIRKGWKAAVKRARLPVEAKARFLDWDQFDREADARIRRLSDLIGYVRALRADLLINKGLWTSGDTNPQNAATSDRLSELRRKTSQHLDGAEQALADAVSRTKFWKSVVTPGTHDYRLDGGTRRKSAERDERSFQMTMNAVTYPAKEAIDDADKSISGRLLRSLTRAITKVPVIDPTSQLTVRHREIPIELERYEPSKIQLGRVTVLFADAPAAEQKPSSRVWPGSWAIGDPKPSRGRHPKFRKEYIQILQRARAMLKRRGLEHLWYGRIVVMCRTCGGQNQYGKSFGVGAHYHRRGDWISVYSDPNPNLSTSIAHELGHRYWFKFMSRQDRANFSKWYAGPKKIAKDMPTEPPPPKGKVRAVSHYGSMSTEEDWAEVFGYYIDGRRLDRDQLDRLKAFLGKKRKLESVQGGSRLPLLTERETANFAKVDALLNRLRKQVRDAVGFGYRGREPTDTQAQAIARDAKELHGLLDITAENPRLAYLLKKRAGKIRNFRKVLLQLSRATTGSETGEILRAQSTKSKDAMEKFFDWSNFVRDVIGSTDSEVDEVIQVGPFRVVLVTAWHQDWTPGLVSKLRNVLDQAVRKLRRVGMLSLARGAVYAYPSSKLPTGVATSHTAMAAYNVRQDVLKVAAGGPQSELLHAVVHELGHRAYYKLVAGRSRTAWHEFFGSESGQPDLGGIIKRWTQFAESHQFGRYLGHYLRHLHSQSGPQAKRDSMWLTIVADNIGIREKFDPYTGRPKGKGKPGLDQLLAMRGKVKTFLHPVTSYSATNAEELFAETFAAYATQGPRRVPPIVRMAFKRTLPSIRESSMAPASDRLLEATFS